MQIGITCIIDVNCQTDCIAINIFNKSTNILRIENIFELHLAKFMHSFYPNKLTENFNNYFRTASHQHALLAGLNQWNFLKESPEIVGNYIM